MPPVKMSQKDNIDFLAPSFSMTYPAWQPTASVRW
jgi:hypothetical protein